jgi:diguanylate cyclase (GGDEF)-like protein
VTAVRDIAITVPIVSPTDSVVDVDRLFRQDPRLRAVVVGTGPNAGVLSRERLDVALTGPFGYGRSLHSRSAVSAILPARSFALDGDVPLLVAAEQIVATDRDSRYEDVLVRDAGALKIVSIAAVFEHVAHQLRAAALHDPLTALPNRRLLDDHGPQLIGTVIDPARLAVAYIDLDGFKLINDSYGHRAGDEILISFSERLRTCVRAQDVVARLGGDEFAVLLVDVSADDAMAVADRILLSATAPFMVADHPMYLSASVGVAMGSDVVAEPGMSLLDSMVRLADETMLHVKRSGKGHVERVTSARSGSAVVRRGLLRRRLADAVNVPDGSLFLHYQPVLNLLTGDNSAVEALLRWEDAELGSVAPSEFIPLAEEAELIGRLGQWVLHEACAQAARWVHEGQPRVVSINVSPVQLRNSSFVTAVAEALDRWDLAPRYLRLEITETAAVLDVRATAQQLSLIRELGVEIELDDFGAGFSSMALLRNLPLTTVKIDQSFINSIDAEPADLAMVRGVVNSAHALGLLVTAEGVERPEQLALLREVGADSAQGYLISRPTSAEHLPHATR